MAVIVARPKSMKFTLREAAGGLGDLGVFIPLLVGMVNRCGLQLGPALFLAGVMNVVSGLIFRIPMPVQPMKAIAAVAISDGWNEAQILTAGIACGLVLLMLGISGSTDWFSRWVPLAVVRGLQLALGLKLVVDGTILAARSGKFFGWDSLSVALLSLFMVFWLKNSRKLPAALVLFAIGLVSLAAQHGGPFSSLRIGFQWHLPDLGRLVDWKRGILDAALPQIPLTLLNSVVAVCALSQDLFPSSPAQPKRVAVSVALMNLICCPLGGMPMCHGAGGLAGQYGFGARTGGSIVMLGAAKMILAAAFGGSLWLGLRNYPNSVLGVLLACSGLELTKACRDHKTPGSLAVMAITATLCLVAGTAIGVAIGWALATALYWNRPSACREGVVSCE